MPTFLPRSLQEEDLFLFYLVFILAPRRIAFPSGSRRDWAARFVLHMIGVVLNLGWLPVL